MKAEMVKTIVSMQEQNRFSKGIFGWIGFKTYWLSYENIERIAGNTKWNFWKLFKYAIGGIINFSEVPLNIASWFGFLMTFISFFMLFFLVIRRLCFGDSVIGWASIVCLMLLIAGIQLFSLGMLGQYIARIYTEVKKRPHYIISESNMEDVDRIK